jgi:hypothetical protein
MPVAPNEANDPGLGVRLIAPNEANDPASDETNPIAEA